MRGVRSYCILDGTKLFRHILQHVRVERAGKRLGLT